jgi:hypothetical protein
MARGLQSQDMIITVDQSANGIVDGEMMTVCFA